MSPTRHHDEAHAPPDPAGDPAPGAPADLLTTEEAATVLGVTTDRIGALVAEGLLTPHLRDDLDGPRFVRAEVLAVRLTGA